MLLRLMSLHTDIERGRWKKREPRRDPPPAATSSSNVPGGKLTLRRTFAEAVDAAADSSDMPSAE